jgi:hypothetical protein
MSSNSVNGLTAGERPCFFGHVASEVVELIGKPHLHKNVGMSLSDILGYRKLDPPPGYLWIR